MMIPAPLLGARANNAKSGAQLASSTALEQQPEVPPAEPIAATPPLGYTDFTAAIKNALRDFHSPDLLARNPLLRHRSRNLGGSAGPPELKALLSETVR